MRRLGLGLERVDLRAVRGIDARGLGAHHARGGERGRPTWLGFGLGLGLGLGFG